MNPSLPPAFPTGDPMTQARSAPGPSVPPARFAVFDGDLDAAWQALYGNAPALAIDTEAMGLLHGRDRLCLVQICDSHDNVSCIRLARGQREAPRLQALLENPAIEKVFHFARFDVAALAENLSIAVDPIFCTKIASRLGRTYAPRHGLKDVVNELVGVELDKQAQSSDWGRVEELSDTQLAYAAGDVRWLLAARDRLEACCAVRSAGTWLGVASPASRSLPTSTAGGSGLCSSTEACPKAGGGWGLQSSSMKFTSLPTASSWSVSREPLSTPAAIASSSMRRAKASREALSRVPSSAARISTLRRAADWLMPRRLANRPQAAL
jgi:ribonuclease D